MIPVAWSLRTYDTKNPKEKVIRKIRKKLNGGDIILLHDNNKDIPEILDFLIPYAQEIGFKFVSLDKLIEQKAYE
jgi:peptidoglycan/xylan/chitin deacetylase (PgdA/CDA1 family)